MDASITSILDKRSLAWLAEREKKNKQMRNEAIYHPTRNDQFWVLIFFFFYLSVCCDQSRPGRAHPGRASRSCSRSTAACSPRTFSPSDSASLESPETECRAARLPCSTGRYLNLKCSRKEPHANTRRTLRL